MLKKIILFMFMTVPLLAQSFALQSGYPKQYGDGLEFYFVATAQDSGNISSNIMDLSSFDADFATYPFGVDLYIDTLSANDEIIGIYVQGKSARGSWVNVDTLVASDTLNGSHSGLTASALSTISDFGDAYWRFPQYRFLISATHADGNDYTVKLSLYAYKRD